MNDQEKVPEKLDSGSANQGSKADESAVAPEARGVSFDILPPLISKPVEPDKPDKPELSSGGEDTAKVSFWLSFHNPLRFFEMSQELDALKSEAQDSDKESCFVIGGTPWLVKRTGVHISNDKRSPYYRWQLQHGGIRFSIAKRPVALKRCGPANGWVEFGSELLMVSGGLKFVFPAFLQTSTAWAPV